MFRKSLSLTVASLGVTLALVGAGTAAAQPTVPAAAQKPSAETVVAGSQQHLPMRGKLRARDGRVTRDVTKMITPSQQYDIAAGYGKMATLALSACGTTTAGPGAIALMNLKYALRLTTFGRVAGAWSAALYIGFERFSGNNFCQIAADASGGAAWAAYHASRGSSIQTRLYQYQENRTLRPDVCHTYQAFAGTWRVWDLKTSGGCPK